MKVYSPHEIAELLGVKDSTLRKYSILLEEHGYEFQRNKQNQRWYNDKDVIALRKLVTFKDNGDMSLKECAEAVCLWSRGEDVTQSLTVAHDDERRDEQHSSNQQANAEEVQELKELVHKQNQLLKELVQRLNEETTARKETEKKLFEELQRISETNQQSLAQSAASLEKITENLSKPNIHARIDETEKKGQSENGTTQQDTDQKLSWWQRLFK